MRSNKAHRLLALLLAFVMTFSLLPTVTWATTGGDCSAAGDGSVTWSYDADTTTLTIRGNGAMADNADDWPVWGEDITTEVTSLIIKSGVTNVGVWNFYQAASLESVEFPDTLETINECAFRECAALSKITFPQGLKKIGVSAFEDCSALTSINLPQGLEVICDSAFNGAALKGTVRIPSSVTAIEAAAFGTAKGLTIGLNITPGQSARGEGIKLGYGWSGSATVCYYPDLQKTWAKGTEITIAADGEVFTGTIDLNDFSVKMKREMPVVEEFVLNSPTVTSTLGTINSPASLAIKAYGNGLDYYADTTLTLVPPDGTDGDKIPVDVRFILTKPAPKEYVFEGAGTEANPYKISSLADLRGLQTNVNRFKKTYEGEYFLQTADIDMTGVKSWDQIGTIARADVSYPFKATYDGGGHKITNWTFDYSKQSDPRYAGLFGNVSVLKNLTLDETCTFKLRSWSGTLAYQVGRIENCFSYATVTAQTTSGDNANAYIGGLVKLAINQLNSYEAQKNYYTDKIMENKSWTMADIFADEGTTGTSVKKRADFMRMMKWCKQGKIDLILTKSVSRFARNTVDCLNYVRMLKAQGIAVYFEKENINSMDESTELMLTMMGAFAQAESESISGNIQAGKRYAMQRGEATIHYHNLYAYEKGPDGNPQIIPEQAEIVREIYQKYLHGDSLNMIRKDLEERHIPNARGGATWTHTAVRGILSNEKYAGDVLMQKTFQQDCISHKTIRNTGQRTMYLVPDHHEAIIDRKTYNAVQTELARRNALKGNTQKSTPSGRSCYTPKYALSDRVICGECGTLYRRCTWVNRGKKHIVWRCISRFDYGKKYCHDSPAVDEQQLQQAILRVINGVMSEKPALVRRVTENLQVVIRPSRSGELTIADIDHQLETLAQEFDAVFATAASGNSADYSEHFKTILTQQAELKAKRAELKQQQAEDAELTSHMKLAADTLKQADTAIMKWDEYQIRALVESVRILSKDEILVRLKSGIEKIERLQK